MNKKSKSKEEIFWIVFIILVLTVAESASYFSTGNFVICGRFGNCGEIPTKPFFLLVIGIIIFSLYLKFSHKFK